ncbi:MAG TPA: hypothetical protein VFS32_12440 [Candidatus Limnocylindrales bacterium]|nr:hypothetical protein [Candidatus Limnocylindrales bacterium]
MRRALVVHHDIDLADQEADSLRRRGYEVRQCSGPTANRCPILAGNPCELADEADVLVYDAFASGDTEGARRLIEGLRRLHPDVPVVLTTPGLELEWMDEADLGRVVALSGQPTGERLDQAITQALGAA